MLALRGFPCALLAVLCALLAAPATAETHLVLLGTGTPYFSPLYSPASSAVVVDGVPYMVDAGEGAIRQIVLAANTTAGASVPGLDPSLVSQLFLTHLHSDHTMGVGAANLLPWALGRNTSLGVYGPNGTTAMVDELVVAASEDIRVRLLGLSAGNTGYIADGHDIDLSDPLAERVVFRDERVTVTAFPVVHGPAGLWESLGYRFDMVDGSSVVFSGDTHPVQSVVEACAKTCDALVHEVYPSSILPQMPETEQEYFKAYHTSTDELVDIADAAGPGLLVLSHHVLLLGATPDTLLQDMAAYEGEVQFGRDLDVVRLSE